MDYPLGARYPPGCMLQAEINCLVIVESLTENFTGRRLFEDVQHNSSSFPVKLHQIRTRSEFDELFRTLTHHARTSGLRPILHFEIHGLDDQSGLQLASEEPVRWTEFADLCRRLVLATSNNLLVTMAVCHGYWAVLDSAPVDDKETTPFTWLVGPADTVTSGEIEESFTLFFMKLIETRETAEAVKLLPSQFRRFDCEELLAAVFKRYVLKYCRGRAWQERLEKALAKLRESTPDLDVEHAQAYLAKNLAPSREQFEGFRASYLLADRPENVGRFTITFEEVMKRVDAAATAREP